MTEFSVPDREGPAYCALTPVELEQVLKTNAKHGAKFKIASTLSGTSLTPKYGAIDYVMAQVGELI